MLECKSLAIQDRELTSPTSPIGTSTLSDVHTVVAPALVSPFEAKHYWHGISDDPPELLYRSDLESNPFPLPKPGVRFFQLPVKTASGTWGTAMNNQVWREVAPLIVALFKERRIMYSALMSVRFSIEDENGKKVMGPLVVWVALHPGRNTASDARDVSPDVLNILVQHGVEGAVVEWYEGVVEKLLGPPLLRVTNDSNPSYYVRRALTAALGMPIAAKEREGSVSFFFHENRDKDGAPSNKVFGVSNKHVLRKDTTVDYDYRGPGAPRQYLRVCGDRRYKRFMAETRALIHKNIDEAVRLAEEVTRLENLESTDEDEAADNASALKKNKVLLEEAGEACVALENFLKEIDASFHDIAYRGVGWVDWAPKIASDIDANRYTLDIGTFELDSSKFSNNSFKGNVVELGSKFEPHELNKTFWPNDTNASGLKYPSNRQLKIRGVVTRELLANPDCYDDAGNAMYVVAKDGNATDLTVGRYTGLEAYLCDESGRKESIEVPIFNYSKTAGNFSAKGDSGSLIFTGDGRKLAVLHSGMPHVTFGTPAWWVVDRLMLKYKYADFDREAF
ncbi:hypothetical protein SCHPADRAFT_938823 [Schizopora paradoxa]|uniref:Uncharacterized protein n=1 Tax=Schizopora paradoxa TaxID=27342 RepID=A0A0H2RTZ8_9AGAM|nr:hypothetical protein SCHPADRAFT_938823 [Schizopora paradoxa]